MKKVIDKIVKMGILVPALLLGIGFTVALAQPVAAAAADGSFTQGIGDGAGSAKGTDQAACLFGNEDDADCPTGLFQTITNILLFVIGAISVIMLIIGGLRYVLSGGDQAAVTSAKNTILYAVIGMIVAILAYAIVNFVIGGLVSTDTT